MSSALVNLPWGSNTLPGLPLIYPLPYNAPTSPTAQSEMASVSENDNAVVTPDI